MKLSLRADSVNTIAIDDGTGSRAVVVAVTIFEVGGVAEGPLVRTCFGMHALDELFVADPVHDDKVRTGDRRRPVARAFGKFPEERRWQQAAQPGFRRDRVMGGPEKGCPVVRHGIVRQWPRLAMHTRLRVDARTNPVQQYGLYQRAAGDHKWDFRLATGDLRLCWIRKITEGQPQAER